MRRVAIRSTYILRLILQSGVRVACPPFSMHYLRIVGFLSGCHLPFLRHHLSRQAAVLCAYESSPVI